MKQEYTLAYLRYKTGLRPSKPNPAAYGKSAEQGRALEAKARKFLREAGIRAVNADD
jgi:hypothetical protein